MIRTCGLLVAAVGFYAASMAAAAEHELHRFKPIPLTDVYFSEGANVGDVDGDGVVDAVYGPYWFKGPAFSEKHEIYKPKPQHRDRYYDHFLCWLQDFNGDGRQAVFTICLSVSPGCVYEYQVACAVVKHSPNNQ